jgi:aspartate-semialdehyde dehydrogenase
MSLFNVAIVGATGAVGREILDVLERRSFPTAQIKLLASSRSAGEVILFGEKELLVEELNKDSFTNCHFAFFSAGKEVSKEYAPIARQAGAIVIDNTTAFRMDQNVPLVVPEVNASDLKAEHKIIANPNCSAAILAVVLAPLHKAFGLKRVVVSTYQSVSGAGARAMQELLSQIGELMDGKEPTKEILPHQIAFNLFSHNSAMESNGFKGEENKITQELRKMLHLPELSVFPTCVRVPILRAHSESVLIETEKPLQLNQIVDLLKQSPGIKLVDDAIKNHFPMPLEASGELDVLVGRLRLNPDNNNELGFFLSGDQLLKGAAWNAVQIAESIVEKKWIAVTA